MAEIALEPAYPLGRTEIVLGENRIADRSGVPLVSVAIPLGGEEALAGALERAYALALPSPVLSTRSGGNRAIRTAPDQLLLMLAEAGTDPARTVAEALDGAGYVADQTDAWTILSIGGPQTRAALERLCPLDLDPGVFGVDAAARTAMEHMGAVILREDDDAFLLMAASSSARSFLHAVETCYRNVTGAAATE